MAKGSAMNDNTGVPPQTPPPSYPEGFQAAPLPEVMQPPAPLPHNQPYLDPSQAPAPQQYPGHQNPDQQYTPQNYPAQQYVQPVPVPQYQPADPSAVYPQADYPLPPVVPSHPQQVPQAAHPTTSASTDATTSLPMDAPRKKSRLGLILGVLVVVAALIVGVIFAVPYLTSSGEKELPYPLVRPSDAWANGAQKTWEVKFDTRQRLLYAQGDYMITKEEPDPHANDPEIIHYKGWKISTTSEPEQVWDWEIEIAEKMPMIFFSSFGERIFATYQFNTGDAYSVEFDIATGQANDEKFVEKHPGTLTTVELRSDYYIKCTQPDNDYPYLSFNTQYATRVFFNNMDEGSPRSCSAMEYNHNVLWELKEEDFPTEPGRYAVNVDTGEIIEAQEKAVGDSIRFSIIDSQTAFVGLKHHENGDSGVSEFSVYDSHGKPIGSFKLNKPTNQFTPFDYYSVVESLTPEEAESLVTKENVDLKDLAEEHGYLDQSDWVAPDGIRHPLSEDVKNMTSRILTSPDGQVVTLWNNRLGDMHWMFVRSGIEDDIVADKTIADMDFHTNFLARPDFLISSDSDSQSITAYVPKE